MFAWSAEQVSFDLGESQQIVSQIYSGCSFDTRVYTVVIEWCVRMEREVQFNRVRPVYSKLTKNRYIIIQSRIASKFPNSGGQTTSETNHAYTQFISQ